VSAVRERGRGEWVERDRILAVDWWDVCSHGGRARERERERDTLIY